MINNSLQIFFNNNFDQSVVAALAATRNDFSINFFKAITFFGGQEFIVSAILVILIILYFKQRKSFIMPFVFVVAGASILTYLGKILTSRPRPLLSLIKTTDFSFPSGHATVAVAFYGYLAYILIKSSPAKYKWLIITVSILIIFLIGFSRLYLGAHYPSDVITGYLVGLAFLIIGIKLSKKII